MADFSTGFEDLDVGEDFASPVDGWSSSEGVQEVVSSPARGTRAVYMGDGDDAGGNIFRDITIAEDGIDITYWVHRVTGLAGLSGAELQIHSLTGAGWAFAVGFTLDGGWKVFVASTAGSPSDIRESVLFTPPDDEWFKMRVRAQKAVSEGDDATVIVSINDIEYINADDVPMPAVFARMFFLGVNALVDDVDLTDGFNDEPEPITCFGINLGALGSLLVKAHRSIGISLDGGDHVLDEAGTLAIWLDKFRVAGLIDFSEATLTGVTASDPRRVVYPLGGSRNAGLLHNAVRDAYDYIDVEIDSAAVAGMTVRARVDVRVGDSGISVTPEIYNVTDASVEVSGSACSATNADYTGTNQKQTLTITPASGTKSYRLRLTPSANTFPVWGIGTIEVIP